MKVILMHDIADQGKQGDIVNVSDGYARNYLFPRKLAVEAAGGALKNLQVKQNLEERRAEKMLHQAEKTADQLRDKTITLTVRAGGNDRLYGRVTAADIADAAKSTLGVAIDKRKVGLLDAIKALGEYEVPIKLHRDVTVPLKVSVVAAA